MNMVGGDRHVLASDLTEAVSHLSCHHLPLLPLCSSCPCLPLFLSLIYIYIPIFLCPSLYMPIPSLLTLLTKREGREWRWEDRRRKRHGRERQAGRGSLLPAPFFCATHSLPPSPSHSRRSVEREADTQCAMCLPQAGWHAHATFTCTPAVFLHAHHITMHHFTSFPHHAYPFLSSFRMEELSSRPSLLPGQATFSLHKTLKTYTCPL